VHILQTDLEYGSIVSSGRKSVTLKASSPSDKSFSLRRVVRSPYERVIKEGLLARGLSNAEFEKLHRHKKLVTECLCDWPLQHPIFKFTVFRLQNVYTLSAIDEKSTDSYLLKTREWEQIKTALRSLTGVLLPSPLVLEFYNPFSLYTPFNKPPLIDTFEKKNAKIIEEVQKGIDNVMDSGAAGFLTPKIMMEYYGIIADLERLSSLVKATEPPPKNDFN
jgi:hypothetical protein